MLQKLIYPEINRESKQEQLASTWNRLVALCEHIAEPHFDISETAELLGLERRTVQFWVVRKKLPVRLIEGKNYIRLADIEKIIYEGSASKLRELNRRLRESKKLAYERSKSLTKHKNKSNS